MITEVRVTKNGSKLEIESTSWSTFQEYYNECQKKRNNYILQKGEDIHLKGREDSFLRDYCFSNKGFGPPEGRERIKSDFQNFDSMAPEKMREIIDDYNMWKSN
ncbi:MAG: hypothetical protein JSV92_03390 [archaeon]|nr:MAG: hypothetical protein JSV92_03390 [archaeon]